MLKKAVGFLLFLFVAVNCYAKDKLIFAYYTGDKNLVNRALEENVETLKKLKNFDVYLIKGDKEGVHFKGKTYKDLFQVLSSLLSDCTKRDCWLIFAGDTVSSLERGFFHAGGRVYFFTELSDFLSTQPKLFFLGFDECSNGAPFILRHFLGRAEYVAGSPFLEPQWGWEGIYENLDGIEKNKVRLPVLFLYYYAKKDYEMRRKYRDSFFESGLVCTGLTIMDSKGLEYSQSTCDNGEPCMDNQGLCKCGGVER